MDAVYQALANRRDTRSFRGDPIPAEPSTESSALPIWHLALDFPNPGIFYSCET